MPPKRLASAAQAAVDWAQKRKQALEKAAELRATRKFAAEQTQLQNPSDELDDEDEPAEDVPPAWWEQPRPVSEERNSPPDVRFHARSPPMRKNVVSHNSLFRQARYSDDEEVEEQIFQETEDETYGDYRVDERHNDIEQKPNWNSDFADDNPFRNGFGMPPPKKLAPGTTAARQAQKPSSSKMQSLQQQQPQQSLQQKRQPVGAVPSKSNIKKAAAPPVKKWDWGNDDVPIGQRHSPPIVNDSPSKGELLWVSEAGVVATDFSRMPKWLQNKLQERENERLSDAHERPVKNRRASSAGPESPHVKNSQAGLAAAKVDWQQWEEADQQPQPAASSRQKADPKPPASSRQSIGGESATAAKRRLSKPPTWNDGSLFGGGGAATEEPSAPRPKPPPAAPMQPKVVTNAFAGLAEPAAAKFGRRANGASQQPAKKKSEEDPETRQMFDKRKLRRDNRKYFMAGIAAWKQRARVAAAAPLNGGQGGVSVFLRKRPIFQHEIDREEFDVVTVAGRHEVVMHNCQMHADLKRMHIRHQSFTVDAAFGEQVDNRTVFEHAAQPLVDSVMQGGVAALFMYGQTGSGKTHTMESIERYAVDRIFTVWDDAQVQIQLAYFEIVGKHCIDLLSENRKEIILKDQPGVGPDGFGGGVQLLNANEMTVESMEDVMALIALGKANRTTSSTHCNAQSSRSHAVLRMTVFCAAPDDDDESGEPVVTEGSLILVDCAGSERKEDSMHHNAEQRKEGAEINASLYALKECVRLRRLQLQSGGRQHVHVPFRQSQLTRVLMECFVREDAKLAVIGTVSPSSTDTEHSVTTLKTVMLIGGAEPGEGCAEEREDVSRNLAIMTDGSVREVVVKRDIPPVQWKQQDVQQWLGRARKGAFAHLQAPPTMDGRQLVRMTPVSLAAAFGDIQTGEEIYQALRSEIERVNKSRSQK